MRWRTACAMSGRVVVILALIAGAFTLVGPLARVAHASAQAGSVVSPPKSFDNLVMATDCSSDASKPLQAWLQQLPSDSTVDLGGACYQIDRGMTLSFPVGLTVEDGTFKDLNVVPAKNKGHGTPRGNPVFDVVGGKNITFENLVFTGLDKSGYDPKLAFQAAIELEGTIGSTMNWLTISKVFGDGINLEPLRGSADHESGQIINPAENISISNVTIKGAGRQGITMASVDGVTVTDVTMRNIGEDAFDLEADQNNEGAENVVIDGCSFSQLFNISMQGPETGPITVENCVMPEADEGWAVRVKNSNGHADAGPITFDDDVFNCGASVYVACFDLDGATDLIVENSTTTIGYPRDQIHEKAYFAQNNTDARFINDTVSGYGKQGRVSSSSNVTVTGGRWSEKPLGTSTVTFNQSQSTVSYGVESADTFVVTVTGSKTTAPTGTVTISDTTTDSPVCIVTLVPGSGSTSGGTCAPTAEEFPPETSFSTLAAVYYGDENYQDSLSTPYQAFAVASGSTTTTLGQTESTVSYGAESSDVFSTTVTGEAGGAAPSGTVSVADSSTSSPLCTVTLVAGSGDSSTGTCSPDVAAYPSGTAFTTVAASYHGDVNYGGSQSTPPQSFTVASGSTSTTLSQTESTVSYGAEDSDTFSTTVTGQAGGVAPTGIVSVADASTSSPICSATLVTGSGDSSTATCRPTADEFPPGTSFTTVAATYEGDANYADSMSTPPESFTVASGPTPTTTTLTQTEGTLPYGTENTDTFSAVVTGRSGGPAPTGIVSVADASTSSPICSATLVTGSGDSSTATCGPTAIEFPPGTAFTTVAATYEGDTNNSGSSSSSALSLTVVSVATSTTLSQSQNTVAYGSEGVDSFSATVTGQSGGAAPSGTVTVADAGTTICTASLVANPDDSATATCIPTATEFSPGTAYHAVTATYSGYAAYLGSASSPTQSFSVAAGSTTTTMTETESTVTYASESDDSFTATVVGQGGAAAPSGTVSVDDAATLSHICSAGLVAGPNDTATATCSPTDAEFPPGTAFTMVDATYGGSASYGGSVSPSPLSFAVASGSTTTTLDQTQSTVAYGSESGDSFTATVTGQSGGAAPSGTISIGDTETSSTLCTATLVAATGDTSTGICSPTDVEFLPGTAFTTVVATYEGDGNYGGSASSTGLSFTVQPGASATTLGQTEDSVPYGSESADSLSVTVTGQAGGVAPSGTISIGDTETSSTICTATLVANADDSATATCSPTDTAFADGTAFTTVVATYGGDANYTGSVSSPPQTFTVTDPTSGPARNPTRPRADAVHSRDHRTSHRRTA
jgi:Bacterial Ig-like domain (group 3)